VRGSTIRFLRRDSRPENGTIRPLPSECCDRRFNHGKLTHGGGDHSHADRGREGLTPADGLLLRLNGTCQACTIMPAHLRRLGLKFLQSKSNRPSARILRLMGGVSWSASAKLRLNLEST
jgi:hypothetical protein